jgi:hypothetical protein
MSTANLDAADLAAALAAPGLIREDVMDMVYNLDEGIPTPFTDMVRSGSHSNAYSEWTEDDLTAVDITNAVVDGADASGNDTAVGTRVGNRQQISDKTVRISHVSEAVDSIGSIGRMAYQTAKRLMDLRRDVEAIAVGRQASVADDGNTTAGKTAGLAAWIATNADVGAGAGAVGGFDSSTKLVDAPVAGTVRALTWANVRSRLEEVYTAGGYPSVLMSIPAVIKGINTFLFGSGGDPYRAAPTANVQGTSPATQAAQGWITVVLSDFGISLSLVDNRLQQKYNSSTAADVFILDPAYLGLSYLGGYRNDELGKTGHSEMRMLSTTWMTKCFREDAHALIADIDHTAAVTAS